MNARTLNEMWMNSCREFSARSVVCTRQSETITDAGGRLSEAVTFAPVTYAQLGSLVETFGRGLIEIGLGEEQAVALLSENCLRWLVCDLAVLANRAFDVPRGVGFPEEEVRFILDHSEATIAIVQTEEELKRVNRLRPQLAGIASVVVLDEGFTESRPDEAVYSFDDVMALGRSCREETVREFERRRAATSPTDLATAMYTSGTTGDPKGIPLTHANIMHNVETLPAILDMTCRDRFLSFLPIWHVFERAVEYICLRTGASVWYTTGLTLARDLTTVEPTILVAVPHVWVLLHDGVMAALRRRGKEKLFASFYAHSLKVLAARRYRQGRQYVVGAQKPARPTASPVDYVCHWLADRLIYRTVRKRLGRAFRAGISGGGALPENIDDFFEAMGLTILEGYGLTETSPVLSIRRFDRRIPYTVGEPLPRTSIQVRDEAGDEVPDGGKGHIWVHGPQVMAGYYRNPEATAGVMRKDAGGRAWFNTGDIGRRVRGGDISIVGRAKDTIVLLGGENVEPARIEAALLRAAYVDQVMVCGQDQEYLTALIVPNPEKLRETCQACGVEFTPESITTLSDVKSVHSAYMHVVSACVPREGDFREVELVHSLAFVAPFTPEDDTLTKTAKIKRRVVRRRDEQAIRRMYPHYNEAGQHKGTAP